MCRQSDMFRLLKRGVSSPKMGQDQDQAFHKFPIRADDGESTTKVSMRIAELRWAVVLLLHEANHLDGSALEYGSVIASFSHDFGSN